MATTTIPAATEANNTNSTEHLMHKIQVEFDRAFHSGGFGSPFPTSDSPAWTSHEGAEGGRALNTWQPQIDITDCGEQLKLRCDLPGVHREHINVHLRGGRLVINGKREAEKTTEDGDHITRLASFSRAFSLPDGVTPDDVQAEIGESVLHVQVRKPKAMLEHERKENQQIAQQAFSQDKAHVGFAPESREQIRNL